MSRQPTANFVVGCGNVAVQSQIKIHKTDVNDCILEVGSETVTR